MQYYLSINPKCNFSQAHTFCFILLYVLYYFNFYLFCSIFFSPVNTHCTKMLTTMQQDEYFALFTFLFLSRRRCLKLACRGSLVYWWGKSRRSVRSRWSALPLFPQLARGMFPTPPQNSVSARERARCKKRYRSPYVPLELPPFSRSHGQGYIHYLLLIPDPARPMVSVGSALNYRNIYLISFSLLAKRIPTDGSF